MQAIQGSATIMVVDDMEEIRKLLTRMLNQWGYRVEAFSEGMSAVQEALEHPPDLFLLDINMPGLDGFEVCKLIKDDAKLKGIPVIFISVLDEALDKVKAFGSGAVDYITKPFQIEEVFARVTTHIKMRQYRQKLERQAAELKEALGDSGDSQSGGHAMDSTPIDSIENIREKLAEFREHMEMFQDQLDDESLSQLHLKIELMEEETVKLAKYLKQKGRS